MQPVTSRTTGSLLLTQGLLMFVPIAILGAAINWPASLSEPAAVVLPLIQQQADAVRLGYLIYLGYSLLFWPVALFTAYAAAGQQPLSPGLKVAVGFAGLSVLARCLGIIRWLVPMPALAKLYTDPNTSEATRSSITIVYDMLNNYAGSIGEVLGVSLFAGLWLGLVSWVIIRDGQLPRWLGWFGMLATVALFGTLVELFGIDLGAMIAVTTTLIHIWFMSAGVVLLLRHFRPTTYKAYAKSGTHGA